MAGRDPARSNQQKYFVDDERFVCQKEPALPEKGGLKK
jgi:hypothetical protein